MTVFYIKWIQYLGLLTAEAVYVQSQWKLDGCVNLCIQQYILSQQIFYKEVSNLQCTTEVVCGDYIQKY